jgi:Protein of unknown function (DUF664)
VVYGPRYDQDTVASDADPDWEWHSGPDGRTPSLRRLPMDMIEEYGRHPGDTDLIRESVDGLVGEDPRDNG